MQKARAGAVDVATDAIAVAQTVQAEGAQAAVDAAQLQALQDATAHLDELLAVATADEPAIDRTSGTSRSAVRGESAQPSAAPSTSPPAAQPSAAPSAGAEQPTAPATPSDPAATQPAPTQPTQPAPTPSADATPDPASVFEQTPAPAPVPTIPPSKGEEDATTAQLREAVAEVATLTTTVRQSAEAKKAADAAAAKAAADAAAAQAAADAAAAAQVEQRAGWKKSLLGYANGKIPASALCGVSFDPSVQLRCDAAEQLDVLNNAYKARFGTDLVVSDSYRSYAGQIVCKRTKGYLCATPGTSNHGTGVAVDLGGGVESFGTKQHRWMEANGPGLSWTHPSWAEPGGSKPEAWHWEYVG